MSKKKCLPWLLLSVYLLGTQQMKAQTKFTDAGALNPREQMMVTISALTAGGNLEALKTELPVALDSGLSINEIKELLVQLYAYCGFPRSLNAINTFRTVMEDRKAKDISDQIGRPILPADTKGDHYERGRKVLETLSKTPQSKPAPGFGEFAPRIDAFLKAHLFADVFESDVLSYKQRELITISALAAMPGVEGQLQSHLQMGMNTGITEAQISAVSEIIAKRISKTQANVLNKLTGKPSLPVTDKDMMVRISEIEIFPEYLNEYKGILKEESAASIRLEPGVISLFAMYQKENPAQVRIVEIYANKEAYQSHIKAAHFQHYKTATLKMVKSLKLVDMADVDTGTMQNIFKKIN
ncbi:carboxymuconolactone decarboxylase family protein [Pedobacter duraquae]|uniref:Alkylhydroperoxidase/carboxymuconolactone decarboxylase family protein YurZ n=1 Tax=Pedobacter duraquae TaxID=425511 RepID=A0A4R6IF03_9SPHI|nr:carboxymuconolactone decarboxylase family protein [Pedobacter duraquae]TDO20900.1 alkylhydroperoxidase/carboxymuconolactone decarboxylase family protein YurZ [Pedobacter duraquae]